MTNPATPPDFQTRLLDATRRILNETRQDRICRPLLARQKDVEILPFLGALQPAYFFLGLNPAGYQVAPAPAAAEDYLDYATSYFDNPQTDRASFAPYLPMAANHMADYSAFGQAACVSFLVPIVTPKSSDVPPAVTRACWPRTRRLLDALRPNLILVHGSPAWKFLSGQEAGEEPAPLVEVPDSHRAGLPDIYTRLDADKLPFQSRWEGLPEEYRPWLVPLLHLGGAGASKEQRKKADAALVEVRRRISSPAGVASAGPNRIRVRRPGS